ncbi:hypothetical protein VSDG_10152 [Cytospora chrysosperma]|uniref:Cutinase n=1 Tax=Cytospora chrysosperma TaxID=252740 RepID=A0A423V7Q6_CYTCH|nr:hypothetical protein VSDG_10152 [Valsa sordida]
MHYQQLLAACLSATVAALPSNLRERQASGTSGLGSLLGGTGTGTGGLTLPSDLSGLGSLLGGTGTGTGGLTLPTGLLSGLGSGTGTGTGGLTLPSGLSGLGSLLGGTGTGTGGLTLPSDLSGLGSLLGGTGTGTGGLTLPTGLSGLSGLSDLSGLSSTSGLSARASISENGLDDACKNVTLIFARGTTELGNMGSVVGPSLSTDVKKALNDNVAVQGVDYAANVAGIAEEIVPTGGPGTKSMVADVTKALTKCPDTQIVLSGYSQGAMLVHNTMHKLSSTQAASVKAAVTFGDPFDATEPNNIPKGNFKSFCATGDPVCSVGAAASPSSGGTKSKSVLNHLGYGADSETAATFIQGKVSA